MGTKQVGICISAGIFLCLCAGAAAAPPTHTISGYVRTAAGTGVEGTSVFGNNGAGSMVTGADGAYSIIVPNKWDGTIAVSKAGWFVTPASKTYSNVSADIANENYIAYQPKISGLVTKSDGTPFQEVTVTATHGGGNTVTNASGYYELFVPYNWSGTVNSTKMYWAFEPNSIPYAGVTADQTGQNYRGSYVGLNGSGTQENPYLIENLTAFQTANKSSCITS